MAPVLEIADVIKRYQGLRPLRLRALTISAGERVALIGLDAAGAQVLVNLVTGASIPDEGRVRVLGRETSEITSGDEWLGTLDRFGIMSDRAVLLEGATIAQNLAMPFTLQVDPIPPEIATRVSGLARECGIRDEAALTRLAGEAPPEIRARVHLARAVALDPALLILEHPTTAVPKLEWAAFARDVARVAEARALTALIITQDESFATRIAHRTLRLEAATGVLKPAKRGWFA
jgi:ABC-type transporter Mla maintaining outer membrane lipid asymmetry ATPase subunit MlaF